MPLDTSSANSDSMERSLVGSFFFLPFFSFLPFFFLPFFFFFLPFLPSLAARSASTMSLRFCSSTRISSSTWVRISSNTMGRSSSLTSSASYFWKKLALSSRSCHLATNSCTAASMAGMNTLPTFSSTTSSTASPFLPLASLPPALPLPSLPLPPSSSPSSSASTEGGGGLRMSLEPPSSGSGKSGYSPVSPLRCSTNHALMRSWMASRMSCPSSSRTFCLSDTTASSYSRMCSSWMRLRRIRFLASAACGSFLGSRGFGFMPMNMSSRSLSFLMRRRQMKPRMADWMRRAASSCVSGTPILERRSSIWRCFLRMPTSRARSRACRPLSFFWMSMMASSSASGAPILRMGDGGGGLTPYLSTSASRNLSRSSSSLARSSMKYLGTGTSSTSGDSFRSTRMSSRDTKSSPRLSLTIQWRTSSMRPIHASSAFRMSNRFCGCTVWSYAVSSFRRI
mmetsp:Transcript_23253/g.59390  ORF Transcript_23253/g.59390 Transcript_23253/m.59390 type:complete len:453 (-) Transcript_23253:281-1639(-)